MGELTIKEIAKMAGVSPAAVSFVLNGKKGVSEKTRARVNEVIARTNYRPCLNSRRLFFKKSFTITLAIRKTSSPFEDLFYFEIAKGLLERSKAFGYNIGFAEISCEKNVVLLPDVIRNKDTDGIVFLQDTEKAILNEIDKLGIPYVVVDTHTPDAGITAIYADYELSAFAATRYLLERGHEAIAFIGSSFLPDFYLQSFAGFKKALDQSSLSIPAAWIQIDAADEDSAYRCMDKILSSAQIPSAVFCAGDIFAISAMACAKDRGYKVPEDISFIAIDDILLSRYCEPKLTTVRIDKMEMGRLAMKSILAKIDGKPAPSVAVESDHIVERNSVCRL